MSPLVALFLGFLQGITEFLPISSSGHLGLAQKFLQVEVPVSFYLICHLGTLLAILLLLRGDLIDALRNKKRLLILGSLPLLPLPLIPLHYLYALPALIGCCLIITSLLLFLADRAKPKPAPTGSQALLIGLFQACAVLPGISRSGATIAGARLLGWKQAEAVRFSFLLAIPAILGAMVVESRDLSLSAAHIVGLATSFVTGLSSLWLSLRWLEKGKLMPFAIYCFVLGVAALL